MGGCVWYVSKYVVPPGSGGVGGRGYLLMRELARLGHRVSVITSDSNQLSQMPVLEQSYVKQRVDGLDLWWIRTLKYKGAKSIRRVLSWLDFEWRLFRMRTNQLPTPDAIVVSSLSLLTILNGLRLRRQYGCRLVFEIRDIWPLTLTEEGGFRSGNPLIKCLAAIERLGYRRADVIVGTMPNLGEHVQSVLGYPRPVACIPMGFDVDQIGDIQPLPDEYLDAYIPSNKFIVAYAGSIGISNALDTLLECAERLRDRSDIHFLLVGDGDLRGQYERRYGQQSNITFGAAVRKNMVQAVLQRCDVLYFAAHDSAVWRYGQSLNKVIDYMLAGKPIVASYTGYPSMINEAECGHFVPAGNVEALTAQVEHFARLDSEMRTEIGLRGRNWLLANRDYRVLARRYVDLLFSSQSREIDKVGPVKGGQRGEG